MGVPDGPPTSPSSNPLVPPTPPPHMHPPPPYSTFPPSAPYPLQPPVASVCWRSSSCPVGGDPQDGQGTVYVYAPAGPGLISPHPFPGIRMEAPVVEPLPGQVVVGYETVRAEAGCCKVDTLTPVGWCFTMAWLLVCWPMAITTCLVPAFHEIVQRPVYGTGPMQNPPASKFNL